ncbi:MAG: alpha/beta hydrolase [Acidimicrobiales bacterium]
MAAGVSLVVALHGFEDEPRALTASLAPIAARGLVVVTPRAEVDAPGGPAWFTSDDHGPIEAELRRSLEVIGAVVDQTAAEHGVDRSAIVLGGFSQGGVAALAFALHDAGSSQPLGGLFSINGYLLHAETISYDPAGLAAGGTPVLVVHGTDDEVVAVQQGRSTARLLERHGVATRFVETEGGHHLGAAAVGALGDWLDELGRATA